MELLPAQLMPIHKRRSRVLRQWQIFWRKARTLWREFRTPIVIFFLTTFAGGIIYGELYELAGYGDLPIQERPYMMFQLMILEAPHEIPPELYLLVFWYGLPPVFIFIVGNGAAEFVRLFFNRDPRRDEWKEAIVDSTSDHVIVIGAGHVGLRVIRMLRELDVDVVAIECEVYDGLEAQLSEWDVPLFIRDARQIDALKQAGVERADSVVVCTGNDHANLDIAMTVREISEQAHRHVRIIVRVWGEEYARQIRRFAQADTVLSSSALSAPAFAGAALGAEFSHKMSVCGRDYATIVLTVGPRSVLAQKPVGELQRAYGMDIVLHGRDGEAQVQPSSDTMVQVGDTLVIFAERDVALKVAARNRYG
ncbi:MAG: TrkA family potassium uptake protein [Anaerolineae bacterium]|nr:TrkA family potassium uptake protein [Anaerolineae bacterium]MDW8172855.1 TrkA family potassium uptake protein [Anaerolineae bacterium]